MAEQYRWGSEQIQPGTWVCWTHGPIAPDRSGIVPACPDCGLVALLAVSDKKGAVVYREPTPVTCAGRDHHDLTKPGAASVGWGGNPPGHVWRCLACGDEQHWPRRRVS